MNYPRLSTVLVVLTVALAGCLGGGATGGTDGADGNDDSTTGTDGVTTTDDDSTDGAATGGDSTGGVATTDGGALSLSEADARLRSAGSFTTEWSYTIDGVDDTLTFSDRYEVDLQANRSFERFSTTTPDGETTYEIFVADGTSYAKYGDGEGAFYQVTDQAPSVFDSATGRASGFYSHLEEDAQLVGTETFDGVTVSRYEYTDTEAWQTYNQGVAAATFDTDEEVTITDFEIAALVDDDGVARLTTWTLTGETESGQTVSAEWRYSLTEIGSTSVPDPDWLDEARAQQ